MRVPSNLSRGSVGFNMTPMIDVVFLLIIFFLVSSHLARQEVQLDLDLPPATSGHAPEEDESVRRVVVNVLPEPQEDRRIMVGGTPARTGGVGPADPLRERPGRRPAGGPDPRRPRGALPRRRADHARLCPLGRVEGDVRRRFGESDRCDDPHTIATTPGGWK